MRKFERIRIQKGQAYIRDTGITVSEIVALYLREKSIQPIFQKYSALEANDIFEALGHAIQERNSIISFSLFDMRSPLTNIRGFTDLLLELPQDKLTEQERLQFIQNIKKYVTLLQSLILDFSDWNKLNFIDYQDSWEKYPLDKAIADVLQSIKSQWPDWVTYGEIPDNLPPVKSNYSLQTLLFRLVADDHFGTLKKEMLWKEINTTEQEVFFSIERPFAQKSVTFEQVERSLDSAVSPLALAAAMLKKHGSELQLIPGNDSVIFEFSLPIWEENL